LLSKYENFTLEGREIWENIGQNRRENLRSLFLLARQEGKGSIEGFWSYAKDNKTTIKFHL
jgi:hypothetical protein